MDLQIPPQRSKSSPDASNRRFPIPIHLISFLYCAAWIWLTVSVYIKWLSGRPLNILEGIVVTGLLGESAFNQIKCMTKIWPED